MQSRAPFLLAVLALTGCSTKSATTADASVPRLDASLTDASPPPPTDAAVDSPPDASPAPPDASGPWLSDTLVQDGSGLVVEDVVYRSGALKVHARICRPLDGVAHPVLLLNHGGFVGLLDADRLFCENAARAGYVVLASSYRGEDGSGGKVEVCQGEIDDVRALLAIALTLPYAEANEIVAWGQNHGGCVTSKLAVLQPSLLRAEALFFAPYDWAALDQYWNAQIAQGEPVPFCQVQEGGTSWCLPLHQAFIQEVEGALGGTSSQVPSAYASRSPASIAGQIATPTMLFQGTYDPVVTPDQACAFRAAWTSSGKSVLSWYQDANLVVQTPSAVCGGNWQASSLPDPANPQAWAAASFYLFVYEQQGDGFFGNADMQSQQMGLAFLTSRL